MREIEILPQTIAVVLQVLGFAAVAVGLGRSWADNPDDRSLPARILGPMIRFFWHTVLRAPHWSSRVTAMRDTAWAFDELGVSRRHDLTHGAPISEQLLQVKREVDQAAAVADEARDLGQSAHKKIDQLELRINSRIDAMRTELETTIRRQAADGVPVAVIGLVTAAAGTLVQYAAGFVGQ